MTHPIGSTDHRCRCKSPLGRIIPIVDRHGPMNIFLEIYLGHFSETLALEILSLRSL